jgi:hypothetical protein
MLEIVVQPVARFIPSPLSFIVVFLCIQFRIAAYTINSMLIPTYFAHESTTGIRENIDWQSARPIDIFQLAFSLWKQSVVVLMQACLRPENTQPRACSVSVRFARSRERRVEKAWCVTSACTPLSRYTG